MAEGSVEALSRSKVLQRQEVHTLYTQRASSAPLESRVTGGTDPWTRAAGKAIAAVTTVCMAFGVWYIGTKMYAGPKQRRDDDDGRRPIRAQGAQCKDKHRAARRCVVTRAPHRDGAITVRISEYLWRRLCSITGPRLVGASTTNVSDYHRDELSTAGSPPDITQGQTRGSVTLRQPVDWLRLSPVLTPALPDIAAMQPVTCHTVSDSGHTAASPCAADVQHVMEDRKLPAAVDLRQFARFVGHDDARKLWNEIATQMAVFNMSSSLAVAVARYGSSAVCKHGKSEAGSGDAPNAPVDEEDVHGIPWSRCFTLRIVCSSCATVHEPLRAHLSRGTDSSPSQVSSSQPPQDCGGQVHDGHDTDGDLDAQEDDAEEAAVGRVPPMVLTVKIGAQEWMSVRKTPELLRDVVVTRVMPRLMRLVPCFTRAMASSIVRVVRGFFLPTPHDADPLFVDVLPLLANPRAHEWLLDCATQFVRAVEREHGGLRVTAVAALEARGFMFGIGLATRLGLSFVPLRRPGRYPGRLVIRQEFTKASGPDALELDGAVLGEGERVLIVDDLLVSGGSMLASDLVLRSAGARVCGAFVPFEVEDGEGRQNLWRFQAHWPVYSAICVTSLEDAPRIEDIRDARVLLDGTAADVVK